MDIEVKDYGQECGFVSFVDEYVRDKITTLRAQLVGGAYETSR